MPSDEYNPAEELTVGELYGTRHPRNQLLNEDDFAFTVKRVNEDADQLEVEFVVNGGSRLTDPEVDTVPYSEYQNALESSSAFGYLGNV